MRGSDAIAQKDHVDLVRSTVIAPREPLVDRDHLAGIRAAADSHVARVIHAAGLAANDDRLLDRGDFVGAVDRHLIADRHDEIVRRTRHAGMIVRDRHLLARGRRRGRDRRRGTVVEHDDLVSTGDARKQKQQQKQELAHGSPPSEG